MVLPSQCAKVLQSHVGSVQTAKLDATGEYCMSGGSDKLIRLWNPFQHYTKPIQEYVGHSWEVSDLCIAKDNTKFASVGGDRTCFLWDVAAARTIRKFSGHFQRLSAVDMNEQATVVASGSYDKSVRLWDSRSNSRLPIQILDDAKDTIGSIQIFKTEILVGSVDGFVRVYDIRNGRMVADPLGEAVTSVKFSADGKCYIASCLDSSIRLIDRSDGSTLNSFTGHTNKEYHVASTFSNSDAHILSGSEDGLVYVWDFVSAKVIKTLAGHKGPVSSIAYHPQKDLAVTAGFDGTLRVWM